MMGTLSVSPDCVIVEENAFKDLKSPKFPRLIAGRWRTKFLFRARKGKNKNEKTLASGAREG